MSTATGADVIGIFSMYPDVPRKVLRLLAEIDASDYSSGVHRPRCSLFFDGHYGPREVRECPLTWCGYYLS
jgi:hypothetical protein